jgi:hypothetical protein
MPDPINYQAVLADLESKRAQLDAAIASIRAIMGPAGALVRAAVPRIADLSQVPPDAFTSLSISNASHRLMEMIQRKLSTKEIMQGLRAGGLKPSNYHNTYATLRQREADKADILNEEGFWGLAEWSPNRRPRSNRIGPAHSRKS